MKGGWKGGFKGGKGKGKGKGYQGQCWGCGQIGHKQGEYQNHQQVQQAQPGPVAVPEQPNNVVSPTVTAGFTPIQCGGVWVVGNVEARYRNQTEVQNRFSAFEDESEDAKEVEEKTSEPYVSPKAKKEAFWIRAQAKEKEAKKKAK